jgi:hypothetical protein
MPLPSSWQKSWQEISKEPDQIEKRRVKHAARSAAFKQQQLEKGMLARNTALNAMGYNVAGQGEVYKTQAARLLQDYGYEPSPSPIKSIDASVDHPKIIEYPERPGAEDKLEGAQDADAIMMFEAAHKQREPSATLNAQAGLIATRMRRARAILGKAISRRIVPSDAVNTGI